MKKIKIDLIDDFENHPYQVNDDEELEQLKQSIEQNGLLNPLVVRKKDNGRYELLSGHRRKKALTKLNIEEVEVIVKDLTDEEATIFMVDSNMCREKILPSEKAFAYKMKLDAIKHQGKSTCGNGCHKSREAISKDSGDSARTVQNYIRLTNLIPELLELVDNTVKYDKRTPSHNQAKRIHELSKKKQLSYNNLEKIMQEKGNYLPAYFNYIHCPDNSIDEITKEYDIMEKMKILTMSNKLTSYEYDACKKMHSCYRI